MVAANISITQGSGTRLGTSSYTEGGVTVHDEKTILGETYLPSYIANGAASTTTANSHLYQIMAGASLKVRIRRIEVYLNTLATTAALGVITVCRLSTAGTGGTGLTPSPLDTADGASGATLMQLPTVKGTEGATVWTGTAYFMQTVGASTPEVQPIVSVDFDRLRSKPLVIPAGTANGFALKMETAIPNAVARVDIWFDESSF